MYYFHPEGRGRPVYSYRLSVVHFWALIFTYMWAGPHHLHYTALPELGAVARQDLLADPARARSWGGMINGIMTLSGAWHKLRDDPILKFMIVSLSSTACRPSRADDVDQDGSTRDVALTPDWTIGHVHSGALGWVGFISMGAIYYLLPRLYGPHRDALDEAGDAALLGRHHRHRRLHRRDVDPPA